MRGASVAFALILWYFVTWDNSGLTTRDYRVQLRYQEIPDGYSLSDTVQNVEVRLEARIVDLATLNTGEIMASVGLSDLRPGKYKLPIQIVTPSYVRVVSYSPNVVDVELFRMIERSLRPTLALLDSLPDNLAMSSVDIFPSEVTVKGSEAAVMAVRRAEVRGTVREMSGGERELSVVLMGDNGDVRDLTSEPPIVTVRAQFTKTMQEARIPISAQVIGTPGQGFEIGRVVISPDFVTLRGTREALLGVTEITINPIDITGHTENMNIDIPLEPSSESITIIGADHVNLKVDFRTAVETRTFLGVPVHLVGAVDIDRWVISPPTASVTVEKPAVSGEAFDPRHPPLELFIDATNIVPSQATLPVLSRNVISGVNVIRIEPSQVTITAMNQ
jgi:YbbR domain-containing protein